MSPISPPRHRVPKLACMPAEIILNIFEHLRGDVLPPPTTFVGQEDPDFSPPFHAVLHPDEDDDDKFVFPKFPESPATLVPANANMCLAPGGMWNRKPPTRLQSIPSPHTTYAAPTRTAFGAASSIVRPSRLTTATAEDDSGLSRSQVGECAHSRSPSCTTPSSSTLPIFPCWREPSPHPTVCIWPRSSARYA